MELTTEQAHSAVQGAQRSAEEIGVAVTVVVLDAGGNLKALSRMDRAWLGSVDVALRKARTSVLFEMETQEIAQFTRAGAQAEGMQDTNGGLVTFGGGIPLKSAAGRLVGAVGVSGGTVAQDREVAAAAVRAAHLAESRPGET